MILKDITLVGWIAAFLTAMFIGMGKTGLSGAGNIAIPIMAYLFGGKYSTGIILPLLCTADVFAVWYYHRHADWKHVMKLLPYAFLGIIIATVTGNYINDKTFKVIIGIIILSSVTYMFWKDLRKHNSTIPQKRWYSAIFGVSGGFATMIGNAAGPVMAIYLQSMRLPKNIYIATGAWFFLIVNFSKIPFQVFAWKNITWTTFAFNMMLVPAIAMGAYLGIILVKLLPEKTYRYFIFASTAISALILLV